MADRPTSEKVTEEIVKRLFDVRAFDWTIEEKGVLMAAIKLQLSENVRRPSEES